jgi:retron-type reverse transcriptase
MSNLLQDISSRFDLSRDDLVYLIRSAPYRYKVYDIPKREPGKTRTIAQPAREVKPLQYWVMENILSKFPIHPAATAYRKGRNIADNAQPHAPHRYLCKMDFRNFFPSIKSTDFERFISESRFAGDWSEEEIDYLSRILFWRKKRGGDLRLSIGAPSSPLLSNILLYRFDIEVAELCLSQRVAYTRYADDLTFSTNERGVLFQIEREIPKICTRLKSPRLILNRSKTVHASKKGARRVTGLVLANDGAVSIGRDKKRAARVGVHRFVLGRLDDKETAELAGMVAYIKSVEPAFLHRLSEKYGAAALSRLFSRNRPVEG